LTAVALEPAVELGLAVEGAVGGDRPKGKPARQSFEAGLKSADGLESIKAAQRLSARAQGFSQGGFIEHRHDSIKEEGLHAGVNAFVQTFWGEVSSRAPLATLRP